MGTSSKKLNGFYSWPVIILMMLIFWPIGLFLMYKRFSVDKAATLKNSKAVSVIAYILMAMGIIYLIMTFTEDPGMIAAAILFGGGGMYLLYVSKKMKRNGERYKAYINLTVNQGQTSIDNIAAAVGVSYDEARNDLSKMIDSGFFTGAYINEGNREFLLHYNQQQPYAINTQVNNQTKTVTCKGCGANNLVVSDKLCECEYCGTIIQM